MRKIVMLVAALVCLMCSQALAKDIRFGSGLLQSQFKDLSKEAGIALSYHNVAPSVTLGLTGFDIAVEATSFDIQKSKPYWQAAFNNDAPDYLAIPRLRVRKGLPFGIDVGAMYTYVPDSNIKLFGVEVANASMYDGSTAAWEAVAMATRVTRRGKAVLSGGLHAHYVSTIQTMARFTGDVIDARLPVLEAAADDDATIAAIDAETACAVVQYPDILGRIPDLRRIAGAAQAVGALLIAVVTEPVALGLLEAPGQLGADIVVGEGQSLGVGLQFGGPYLGLFGCREKFVRQMPGRLCGQTVDAQGKRGFVLTLSTREQHIRREKATSNICTNAGLCALAFSIHMTLLGGAGLERLARVNHARAQQLAAALGQVPGVSVLNTAYFNEFTVVLPRDARAVVRELADRQVLGGVSLGRLYPQAEGLANGLIVTATELTTAEDIAAFAKALAGVLA